MKLTVSTIARPAGPLFLLALALTSITASAQLINVQFGQGQTSISPVFTAQGVLAGGTDWNELQTANGGFNNVALVNDSGAGTNVTLSSNSFFVYDQQNTANGAAPDALLQNYIYKTVFHGPPYTPTEQAGLTITLTLNGLAAHTAYSLVVYDGGNPTNYSLNGGPAQSVSGAGYNPSATFTNGSNYADLTGFSSNAGVLSLTAFVTGTNGEPDISGIQLETIPEPSSCVMLAAGVGLLVWVGRFKKNRTV